MKTRLYALTLGLILMLCACSNTDKRVNAMVEELNSSAFRVEVIKTGLLDDVRAQVLPDALEVVFLCRPYINLANVAADEQAYAQLEATSVQEFKDKLDNSAFRQGMEALRDSGRTLMLVWQDVNGARVSVAIDPKKILE